MNIDTHCGGRIHVEMFDHMDNEVEITICDDLGCEVEVTLSKKNLYDLIDCLNKCRRQLAKLAVEKEGHNE